MIINKCVEQGIYVVSILALEKDHRPLRSVELSAILCVSDSYLKKIFRKLVLAKIIDSNAGKEGGFQLSRPIEDISVYDVYSALEGEICEFKTSGIQSRIFIDDEKFMKSEEKVSLAFEDANKAFADVLRNLKFSDLVDENNRKNGIIKFEELVKNARH